MRLTLYCIRNLDKKFCTDAQLANFCKFCIILLFFSIPVEQVLFLTILDLQNPYFYFFANVPKNLKALKMKSNYKNSIIKLGLKSCQNFAENYFMNLIYPKISTFYVSSILTLPTIETCFNCLELTSLTPRNNRKDDKSDRDI